MPSPQFGNKKNIIFPCLLFSVRIMLPHNTNYTVSETESSNILQTAGQSIEDRAECLTGY